MKRFGNLTTAQLLVFEAIAINQDGGHDPATLAKLEAAGLIVGYNEFDGIGSIRRWRVPLPVHREWCAWCAETAEVGVEG